MYAYYIFLTKTMQFGLFISNIFALSIKNL